MRTVYIDESNHEDGNIPKFFRDIWKKTHGQDPLLEKQEYDAIDKKHLKYENWSLIGLLYIIIVAILGSIGCMLYRYWISVIVMGIILACFVVLSLVFGVLSRRHSPDRNKKWSFNEYFYQIKILFELFQIRPSQKLGQMSKEEFVKAIAGSLRAGAELVESQAGFARVDAMERWKNLHAEALKWGLCNESYACYFPTHVIPAKSIEDALQLMRKGTGESRLQILKFLRQNPEQVHRFVEELWKEWDRSVAFELVRSLFLAEFSRK